MSIPASGTLTPAKVGHWSDARLADALAAHNLWRRGRVEDAPFGPADLGLIIDECARRLQDGRETANVHQ